MRAMARSAVAALAARDSLEIRLILKCTGFADPRSVVPRSMPRAENGAERHEIHEVVSGIDDEHRKSGTCRIAAMTRKATKEIAYALGGAGENVLRELHSRQAQAD